MASGISHSSTVETECLALKEFLRDVLNERTALKTEFDQLRVSSRIILQQMEEEEENSEEDDVQGEGRLLAYQSEKHQLDEKLQDLENKLRIKDEQMEELDVKASEYLLRVTTSSNSLFDQEGSETVSIVSEAPIEDHGKEEISSTDMPDQFSCFDAAAIEKSNFSTAANASQTCEVSTSTTAVSTSTTAVSITSTIAAEPSATVGNMNSEQLVKEQEIDNNRREQKYGNKSDSREAKLEINNETMVMSTPANVIPISSNSEIAPVNEMLSLSILVSELRRVKDEMGKCMSVKEKSFQELGDELSVARKQHNLMRQQIVTMTSKLDEKDKTLSTLTEENVKYRSMAEEKPPKDTVCDSKLIAENEELEGKLKVLELMMVEYRAEIETVTGEKTQVEEQAKELVKEMTLKTEENDSCDMNSSYSSERASPDISSADNLDDITQDNDTTDDCSILEEQNRKLSEKLRSTSKYLKALARDREHKQNECTILQEKVQMVEGKMMQLQGTFDTLVSAVMVERDDLVKEGENKSTEINKLNQFVRQLQQREKILMEEAEKKISEENTVKLNAIACEELNKCFEEEKLKIEREHEEKIQKCNAKQKELEEKLDNVFTLLDISNQAHESQVMKYLKEIEELKNISAEVSANNVSEELKVKEDACKVLECKLDSVNCEMNEFINCLKEEMSRMKEDMTKQSEARLQLEVSFDTVSEDHREISLQKKKLEETSVEVSIALNEQKIIVDSLKEQLEDISGKNTSLTCEFHEKEEEYNEELKAREATIQELKITLTNNQKQSSENYAGLQEDKNILQTKMTKDSEDFKKSIEQMELKCSAVATEKNIVEEQLAETVKQHQEEILLFESVKEELSLKIGKLETTKIPNDNITNESLKSIASTLLDSDVVANAVTAKNFEGITNQHDKKTTETSKNIRNNDISYPKELITAWSGTLEELECELSLAKNDLVLCGESVFVTSRSSVANNDNIIENRTKIATMVRRVEELSGVLAATRLRRGLPVESTIFVKSDSSDEKQIFVASDLSVSKDVTTEEKSTVTWSPFTTQQEFESFVAEKEKKITELEERVRELEESLTSKCSHIDKLQAQLDGAKREIGELQESKTFEDHLDDINRLSNDIVTLRDELEDSHSECNGLKSTISVLENEKSEYKSETVKLIEQLETKLNVTSREGESSTDATGDLEIKKNLDERLILILSTIDDRINSASNVVNAHLIKIDELETSYVNKINIIENEYNKKIVDLEKKLLLNTVCSDSNEHFIELKETFEDKIKTLQSSYDIISLDKNKMEEKLKQTESKVGVLNEVKRKLVEYSKTLEDKIHSADKPNHNSSMNDSLNVKNEELTKENVKLKESIALLNSKIDSLHIEKTQFHNNFSQLENEKCILLEQVKTITSQKDILSREHADCVFRQDEINGELSSATANIEHIKCEYETANRNLINLQEEKSHLIGAVELLNRENTALKTLKTELEDDLLSKESDSIANKFKCDELLEINLVFRSNIESLNSNISQLEVEKKNLNEMILMQVKCVEKLKQGIESSSIAENSTLLKLTNTEKHFLELQSIYSDLKIENEKINLENAALLIQSKSLKFDENTKSLENNVALLISEKEMLVKKYEEELASILDMQNMMVSDLEKMVLSLEADKNSLIEKNASLECENESNKIQSTLLTNKLSESISSLKLLEDRVIVLEQNKLSLNTELSQLRLAIAQSAEADAGQSSNALHITEQLMTQAKDLQIQLEKAQQALNHKDNEYSKKMEVEKGGLDLKLQALRKDMAEEMDIIESRKDEETDELVEKYSHLEVEFTSKLAETKDYYETIMVEEKAEFGRVLVTKVSEYEKQLSEKCDEIIGWKIKLMSMQEELDNKMIVIEELEERLDESSDTHCSNITVSSVIDNVESTLLGSDSSSLQSPEACRILSTTLCDNKVRLAPLAEESPSSMGTSDNTSTHHNPHSSSSSITTSLHTNEKVSDIFILDASCTLPSTFIDSSQNTNNELMRIKNAIYPLTTFDDPCKIMAVSNHTNSNNISSNFAEPFVDFPDHTSTQSMNCLYEPGDLPTWHPSYGDPRDRYNYSNSPYDSNSNSSDSVNLNGPDLFSSLDRPPQRPQICLDTVSCSRPILSLVIPSTFDDADLDTTLALDDFETNTEDIPDNINFNPPLNFEIPTHSVSSPSIKTAIFVSREFPSDSTLHKSILTECSRLPNEESSPILENDIPESSIVPPPTGISLPSPSPTSAFSAVASNSTSNLPVISSASVCTNSILGSLGTSSTMSSIAASPITPSTLPSSITSPSPPV